MSSQKSLADSLEQEVLTEMAGTFFGARKNVDDLLEEFKHQVEELKGRESAVFARVLFLRGLLLGAEGEAQFFQAVGLPGSPFGKERSHRLESWRPDRLPFALLPSWRWRSAVELAYAELCKACEAYEHGEYTEDRRKRGKKVLTVNRQHVLKLAEYLNGRIAKLNQEMSPSSVLQYARSIRSSDDMGKGAIMNELGAESLDRGLTFAPLDVQGLGLWEAPALPRPTDCAAKIRAFCDGFYGPRKAELAKALAVALD